MTFRLLWLLDRVRTSFWFVPGVLTVAAALLAHGVVLLDYQLGARHVRAIGVLYSGGADGASAVLSTVAGSMATITGVVFSLVMIPLTLASQQLGPRLMRNFLRDRVNQLALGVFVATFVYCLLVSRTVRRPDEGGAGEFVPHVAITLALVLAVAALGVLIYFIHHVAVSIQADEVIAGVGADLTAAVDKAFPADATDPPATDFDRAARPVRAAGHGYVEAVDLDGLVRLASEHDLVIRLDRRAGHFVTAGAVLAHAAPAGRLTGEVAAAAAGAFVLGPTRTPTQDVEFALHQLVEIALRALSPGVNDPFTAVACIDHLSAALARVAGRPRPSGHRADAAGRVRVVAPPVTFPDALDAALHQIRQAGRGYVAVAARLLEALTAIGEQVRRPEDRAAVRRQAEMVVRSADEAVPEPNDRADLHARFARLSEVLDRRDEP